MADWLIVAPIEVWIWQSYGLPALASHLRSLAAMPMKEHMIAAGGIVSAIGASTCCLLPLALVSAGVGGTLVGHITALAPYQPYFLIASVVFLVTGFWLVYHPSATRCETRAVAPAARRIVVGMLWVKVALWIAASLVVTSVGLEYGFSLFL